MKTQIVACAGGGRARRIGALERRAWRKLCGPMVGAVLGCTGASGPPTADGAAGPKQAHGQIPDDDRLAAEIGDRIV